MIGEVSAMVFGIRRYPYRHRKTEMRRLVINTIQERMAPASPMSKYQNSLISQ